MRHTLIYKSVILSLTKTTTHKRTPLGITPHQKPLQVNGMSSSGTYAVLLNENVRRLLKILLKDEIQVKVAELLLKYDDFESLLHEFKLLRGESRDRNKK